MQKQKNATMGLWRKALHGSLKLPNNHHHEHAQQTTNSNAKNPISAGLNAQ
jgi:hypothetical protein